MLANYYGDRAVAALREICEVRLNESRAVLGADALIEHARGCEIVVSDRQTPGFGVFFDAAPDLVAFLRCAVDIRNVDVPAASRNGILVTRATPGFATSVAEMGLGFMIDLARGISGCVSAYRAGREPPVHGGRTLAGATLGIIGYGVIGVELATLARGLGMSMIVFDPHKRVEGAGVRQVDFETLLAQADFVVCLAVASSETENLMDARAFACMRPDAYFINLSRGELVDETALEVALAGGQIAGAAMDVGRAPDQKPSPKLASRADVVATPHIAGLTPEAVEHQAFDTVEQVRALVEGRLPEHAVNPQEAIRLSRLGIRRKEEQ
nr:NAD(P)-dependent oxidoreductase [Pararhodobacter sp. SW119]